MFPKKCVKDDRRQTGLSFISELTCVCNGSNLRSEKNFLKSLLTERLQLGSGGHSPQKCSLTNTDV